MCRNLAPTCTIALRVCGQGLSSLCPPSSSTNADSCGADVGGGGRCSRPARPSTCPGDPMRPVREAAGDKRKGGSCHRTTCLAEESWTKLGGMDDRAEVHGSKGVAYADLLHGNSIETYSLEGYDYAMEKAGSTSGWSFTIYEEAHNYGFHQEMAHFVDCVQHDRTPIVTGEDARVVLEIIFAAYESARTGSKVALPFKSDAKKPISL